MFSFTSFLSRQKKRRYWGLGVSPMELVLLSKEGMEWMMEWLMWWWLGWMVLVWCYTLHRGKPLCFVMSPLQGRYGVLSPQRRVSTLRFVILPLQGI